MLSAGFEPTISVGERPKTYALDRAATGIGKNQICRPRKKFVYYRSGMVVTELKNSAVIPRPVFFSPSVDDL